MLTKTSGLILRVNKLGENDCLYTILTEDMQKITALSKGIRSLKHKDFAALQLFCLSEMELSKKGGLSYISSANVKNNFYNIRSSVEKLSLASYITEVSSIVSEFTEGETQYFRLILNTLYFIEHADEDGKNLNTELKKLKAMFELRSSVYAGFGPHLTSCVECGCEKNLSYFNIDAGGALCKDCAGAHSTCANDYILKTINFLCYSDLKTAFKTAIKNEDVLDAINAISERYISSKLEYYFKSLDYYKKIIENPM